MVASEAGARSVRRPAGRVLDRHLQRFGTPPARPSSEARNWVLTAADVTDAAASLVADPFMLRHGDTWYMFFEVLESRTNRGSIGLATSPDGFHWQYQQIVLREGFHLSYPCVFWWQGDYYMVPESAKAFSVSFYRAVDFPTVWTCVGTLLRGRHLDCTLFQKDDPVVDVLRPRQRCPQPVLRRNPTGAGRSIRSARSWPPMSVRRDRRAGDVHAGTLIRYGQDAVPRYGSQVRAFVVDRLAGTDYREREAAESPVLAPSGSAGTPTACTTSIRIASTRAAGSPVSTAGQHGTGPAGSLSPHDTRIDLLDLIDSAGWRRWLRPRRVPPHRRRRGRWDRAAPAWPPREGPDAPGGTSSRSGRERRSRARRRRLSPMGRPTAIASSTLVGSASNSAGWT